MGWHSLKKEKKSTTNKILRSKNLKLKFLLSLKKSAEPGFEPRTYRMQNQYANHYTIVTLIKNPKQNCNIKNLTLKFLLSLKKSPQPGFEPGTYWMQN